MLEYRYHLLNVETFKRLHLDRAFVDITGSVDDGAVAFEPVALPLTFEDRFRTFPVLDDLHLADAVTLILTQLTEIQSTVCQKCWK